jgi:hypothetical protein
VYSLGKLPVGPELTDVAHVFQDVSRIPSFEDLEPLFANYLPPYLLQTAKNLAEIVYPHWKERRIQAGGKNINPQLDVRQALLHLQ